MEIVHSDVHGAGTNALGGGGGIPPCHFVGLSHRGAYWELLLFWDFMLRLLRFEERSICGMESRRMDTAVSDAR